mmetsp:Transcript_21860/g.47655  ORF Transcript_21860/g.47655 Transcript_21860/m.47655 type:complete len:211 (-) Transcript_21860:417-1049(-)
MNVCVEGENTVGPKIALHSSSDLRKDVAEGLLAFAKPCEVHVAFDARDVQKHLAVLFPSWCVLAARGVFTTRRRCVLAAVRLLDAWGLFAAGSFLAAGRVFATGGLLDAGCLFLPWRLLAAGRLRLLLLPGQFLLLAFLLRFILHLRLVLIPCPLTLLLLLNIRRLLPLLLHFAFSLLLLILLHLLLCLLLLLVGGSDLLPLLLSLGGIR